MMLRRIAFAVALPVASFGICAHLASRADEVLVCHFREPGHDDGAWYADDRPLSDDETCDLLQCAGALLQKHAAPAA